MIGVLNAVILEVDDLDAVETANQASFDKFKDSPGFKAALLAIHRDTRAVFEIRMWDTAEAFLKASGRVNDTPDVIASEVETSRSATRKRTIRWRRTVRTHLDQPSPQSAVSPLILAASRR